MTAGYYVAEAWQKYANPGEVYICDSCMWADPRYIADYGVQRIEAMPNTPTDAPLAEAETDEARYVKYDLWDGDPQWWRVNELRGEGTGDARTMVLSAELHAALDAIAARDTRVRELEAEVERLRGFYRSVNEALNSGDGVYRP
uniref:hypothetical protein n=1 Tax=Nitrospira cf. moscoviensis SBR1015 TaxID=96242 RepID=UPI001180B26A|nr:hypothetical protein [Nitrospira cf. moscoviensis SBR1015]